MSRVSRSAWIAGALVSLSVATSVLPATADTSASEGESQLARNATTSTELARTQTVEASTALAKTRAASAGAAVVIEELTTSTELTSALPDGTLQYESSTVPVRVKKEGAWVSIDTNLALAGEWLEPAASATPVRFSPGGSDALSQVQTPSGVWVGETWPHGALPAPTVEGPTATYAEVLPGVDLKLTATDQGMATVYVVKSEKAALSAVLRDLHVVLEGATVKRTAAGTFSADAGGEESIIASSPLWWDSSNGGTFVRPGADDPMMPVTHSLKEEGVSMNVAATIKAKGKGIEYPIFVDPDWSAGPNAAWYTDAAYPNQSYLSVGQSDILRVGRYAQYRGNAFFEFGVGALAGKQILSAQLSTTQIGWAACPNSPLQVRTFGYQDPGFTWNQQNHALWGPVLDTQSPGFCGGGPEAVGWNVTVGVQQWVGYSAMQFGLAPQDENANSRRHYSRSATLYVNYNTPPNAPTAPQVDSPQRSCGTASAPAHVSGSSVVVSVHQTDPDGGNVDNNFYLATVPSMTLIQNRTPGMVAQGRRSVTFTGLSEGAYAWYAHGSDWLIDGNGNSGWCYFTVDNTAPTAPAAATAATSFTVGQPLDVSLSSTADTAGYQYWLSYSAPTTPVPPSPVNISRSEALPDCTTRAGGTRFACASGDTPVTISVAPVDALSTLWVSAHDKAGNVSPATALPLFTATGTPAARDPRVDTGHAWMTTSMIDPLPAVIDDSNHTTPLPLYLPDEPAFWQTVAELRPGYTVPVLSPHDPPLAGDAISTQGSAVDATESFSLSMWLRPSYLAWPSTQYIAVQYGSNRNVFLHIQNGKYQFCVTAVPGSGDVASLVSSCVTSPTTAVEGGWALVTGIWDAANQQLRLDVGDSSTPVAITPHKVGTATGTFAAANLEIGPPPTSQRFSGLVANPVIVPGVLDSRQLGSLVSFDTPFTY